MASSHASTEYLLESRKSYVFLNRIRRDLHLSQICAATAMVYYHSFYRAQTTFSRQLNSHLVALASLLLASKVENTPCTLSSLVHTAFSSDNDSERYAREQQLLRVERVLIMASHFTFTIIHPYAALGNFLTTFLSAALEYRSESVTMETQKGTNENRSNGIDCLHLKSLCGSLLNESYGTPLCIMLTSMPSNNTTTLMHGNPDNDPALCSRFYREALTTAILRVATRCLQRMPQCSQCKYFVEKDVITLWKDYETNEGMDDKNNLSSEFMVASDGSDSKRKSLDLDSKISYEIRSIYDTLLRYYEIFDPTSNVCIVLRDLVGVDPTLHA